jgi:hypothetical protein
MYFPASGTALPGTWAILSIIKTAMESFELFA